MSDLTAKEFKKLLVSLDIDKDQAAEKYEKLRLKLIKYFEWRGCRNSQADRLVDITLDRVAKKLAESVKIRNIDAYACEVSRYVWLENTRKDKETPTDFEKIPLQTVKPNIPEDTNVRLKCLRKCLTEVAKMSEEKDLILGYYNTKAGEKTKDVRKSMAERFGITTNNLKQKALRLRRKLEDCINDCVKEINGENM